MSRNLTWAQKPFLELGRLAWPIAVSMIAQSVMTFVDTLMVGRLGPAALAGVALGGVAYFTLFVFAMGMLRSVKILVSQRTGAGRGELVTVLGAGLMVAIGVGVVEIEAAWLVAGQLGRVTATAEVASLGGAYLVVRGLGAPLGLCEAALKEYRYGRGDTKSPMRAMVAANILNVGLDLLFIFGLGWGVAGAAAASALSMGVAAAWLALAQRREGFGFGGGRWRASLRQVPAVWRLGWPVGLQMMLEVSAFATLTALFASMSDRDVAAHQIALQVLHLSFLPAFAIGEAASVMAGQAIGAAKHRLVVGVARRALVIAGLYTGLCALVLALFARNVAGLFTSDLGLIELTVKLLWVAAIFQVFDGMNIVARSVLRGIGDVRFPAVVAVVIAWGTTPPLAWWLHARFGLGALGGWMGICIEIVVGALILWRRVERRHWLPAARDQRRRLRQEAPSPA